MSEKIMQLATCILALSGNEGNKVLMHHLSPAEIIMLEIIHGPGSVTEVVLTGKIERSAMEQKALLLERYHRPPKVDINDTFPGRDPRMPMTFSEADIEARLAPAVEQKQGNVAATVGGKIIKPTEEEARQIAKEDSTVTRTTENPPPPKSVVNANSSNDDDDDSPDGTEEENESSGGE